MVIDEYGERILVTWALCNKEDKNILIHFLNSLKLKVGNLSPKFIKYMSDCRTVVTMLLGLKHLRMRLNDCCAR